MLLCDTHADTLYAIAMHPDRERDVTAHTLKAGNVNLQTMALFVGGSKDAESIRTAYDKMKNAIAVLGQEGLVRLYSPADAREGQTGFMLSIEGCDILSGSLALLSEWQQLGIHIAALTWNHENSLATPAVIDQSAPLKPFGQRAVKAMYQMGIAPDISHLNRQGMFDILDMGLIPMASHSCCSALCPHPRNLTDQQLKMLFEAGGYVGVNFYPAFLNENGRAEIQDVVRHITHMLEMGGEGHIGFGSDFDGIETKPRGLTGPDCFPALLDALRKSGIPEDTVRGIAGENLMNYFRRIPGIRF